MDQSLSLIRMWVQLSSEYICSNKQERFYNAETLCEGSYNAETLSEDVGFKFSKCRKKKIEYKFSVKHFPIWCYKCDTMFFVDKNKAKSIHLS
jgi:hypothetical protein